MKMINLSKKSTNFIISEIVSNVFGRLSNAKKMLWSEYKKNNGILYKCISRKSEDAVCFV